MAQYRLETTLQQDGALMLNELPFLCGDRVEVVVVPLISSGGSTCTRDHLLGTILRYEEPTEPVATLDWDIEQ